MGEMRWGGGGGDEKRGGAGLGEGEASRPIKEPHNNREQDQAGSV